MRIKSRAYSSENQQKDESFKRLPFEAKCKRLSYVFESKENHEHSETKPSQPKAGSPASDDRKHKAEKKIYCSVHVYAASRLV